jgi:hypothetical protein
MLQQVDLPEKSLESYKEAVGRESIAELRALADRP